MSLQRGNHRSSIPFVRTRASLALIFFVTFSGYASDGTELKPKELQDNVKHTLKVAVYRSFTGSFGPGAKIEELFEKSCGCELQWITTEDAGSLFTDLVSGKLTKPDVIVGFDQSMIQRFTDTGRLEPYVSPGSYRKPAKAYNSPFQPIDYSYFSIIVDKAKVKNHPTSLESFLRDSQFRKSFAAQDPRTSSPGFGLLVWLKSISKGEKDFEINLKNLGEQTISFAKGWSQSYGLLMSGEVKAVFSYLTSELFHRISEKTDKYVALTFSDGHVLQVEYAAPVKNSENMELSKAFLNFLHSQEAQLVIATQNWMYPASAAAYEALPEPFRKLEDKVVVKKVDSSLFLPEKRRALIEIWKRSLQ